LGAIKLLGDLSRNEVKKITKKSEKNMQMKTIWNCIHKIKANILATGIVTSKDLKQTAVSLYCIL
jgi:EAL domain-containing protein (putative c-di-GMP-specific phosphodiesterase class I)